jgi:hypothetical protein
VQNVRKKFTLDHCITSKSFFQHLFKSFSWFVQSDHCQQLESFAREVGVCHESLLKPFLSRSCHVIYIQTEIIGCLPDRLCTDVITIYNLLFICCLATPADRCVREAFLLGRCIHKYVEPLPVHCSRFGNTVGCHWRCGRSL